MPQKKNQIRHQVQKKLQRAHQLYGKQEFRAAEVLYQQVLRRDPTNPDALLTLVAIYLQPPQRSEATGGRLPGRTQLLSELRECDDAIG